MLFHTSLLFTLLALAEETVSTVDTLICLYKASAEQLDSMTLRLYHGSTDQYTDVPIGSPAGLMSLIDSSKETVVDVPHWLESLDLGHKSDLINAYLSTNSYNVIQLQYPAISDNLDYVYVVCSVQDVGVYLARALNILVALGLNQTTLSLTGHSLGAHVIGAAGRETNFTVEKSTGLDPAGPGFYTLVPHLASGDAKIVHIYHTDRGGLAIDLQTGDADFYPNDGVSPQPGCTILAGDFCSHVRGLIYGAECVKNHTAFLARKCDSWDDFKAGLCDSNEVIEMSPGTPTTARGSYYLETNSASPFGEGIDGATYSGSNSLIG